MVGAELGDDLGGVTVVAGRDRCDGQQRGQSSRVARGCQRSLPDELVDCWSPVLGRGTSIAIGRSCSVMSTVSPAAARWITLEVLRVTSRIPIVVVITKC